MHRYLTIYQLIAIQEYSKSYKYSISKIAKARASNKSTVQSTLILLNQNLTPLQILEQQAINKHKSGRKNNQKSVSTKTLYNMLKKKLHGFAEKYLLRKGKNKPHKIQASRGKFGGAKSIHERDKLTPDIKNTLDFGHFEGDTIVSKNHKSSIISFDGGKEFSKWKLIEKACDIKIYFADARTPCQRGLIENNNGILRRYFPKSTDLFVDTQKPLAAVALIINSTPRKILNYKKSLDLAPFFKKSPLHIYNLGLHTKFELTLILKYNLCKHKDNFFIFMPFAKQNLKKNIEI